MLLIPKKAGTLEVNDYRSISLVGSIYKILIKLLANILRGDIGRDCVRHRIHLFKADKYLTLFLELMKVWIAILNLEAQGFYANLMWKRLMTMPIGTF